jgi:hypothetical protein
MGNEEFNKEIKLISEDQNKITLFEDTRRCLLTIYRSNIQTHAGYLIAIIVGSLAFVSRFDIFFSISQEPYSSLARLGYYIIIVSIA